MKKSKFDKRLTLLYVVTLILAFATYVYFEFVNRLSQPPLAGISNFEEIKYVCEVVVDLMAIGFVYLALRMMSLSFIRRQLAANPLRYNFWATIRWCMLAVVILSGLAVHYLFLSGSTIGCPLIGALAMIFVWPTVNRRHTETNVNSKQI